MKAVILVCALAFAPAISLKLDDASPRSASATEYHDIAVGVHTGGVHAIAASVAIRDTMLRQLPNHLIMGDVAYPEHGIEAPPSKYFCTQNSEFGNMSTPERFNGSRATCTQFRFAYIYLTLRERFPDAKYFIVTDCDVWMDVDRVHQMLETHSSNVPWLMGLPTINRNLLYGPVLVFSHKLSQNLDANKLLGCISFWYYATEVFDYSANVKLMKHKCLKGNKFCFKNEARPVFDGCNNAARDACGEKPRTEVGSCLDELARDPAHARCQFRYARPEFPLLMYEPPKWLPEFHGDDHVFSFCAENAGGGKLLGQPQFSYYPPTSATCLCDTSTLSFHRMHPSVIVEMQEAKEACNATRRLLVRRASRRRELPQGCVNKSGAEHRPGLLA